MTPQLDRIAIKLKATAEKAVRQGHPWVFETSITKQSKPGKTGDLAIIFSNKSNKFLGLGLFDVDSPIRIKMLHHGESIVIDDTWLLTKIRKAYQWRLPLLQTDTNSYRLIFGENDGLPALIIDVYDGAAVVKIYSGIWIPWIKVIADIVVEVSHVTAIVLRLSRNLQKAILSYQDGQVIYGILEKEEVIFKEHGVKFSANLIHGHKTGFFLDHRHNRKKVGELSRGKTVLDVFSYAGGFSVHALVGGATEVTSLDISPQALKLAQHNAALNVHLGKHQIIAADAFQALEELYHQRKTFDIVVVDPPSFAKQESEVARAIHSYRKLLRWSIPLVSNKGILVMASCSSRVSNEGFFATVKEALKVSGRRYKELIHTGHDIDHPIGFPEGTYLKCGYYQLF